MTTNTIKCACDRCLCEVSIESAITKNSKYYCSEGCANGHLDNQGCSQSSCGCA